MVNLEEIRKKLERAKLEHAKLVTVDYGLDVNRNNNVKLLCEAMVNAAKTGPVKAEYEGRMFVIDQGATMEQTLYAWKEQAWKPYISENFDSETLARELKVSERTDLGNKANSYMKAATVEVLVTKYPEYADKISMLHLLNAFEKSDGENTDAVGEALGQSAKKFINGEETFPINLENIVALNEHKDTLVSILGSVNGHEKLDERIKESEIKMLKSLEPEDLRLSSDSAIYAGSKIATKHDKDNSNYNFRNKFTEEVMNRLSKGKTFNPRGS